MNVEGSIDRKKLKLEDTLCSELKAAALLNVTLVRRNSDYFSFIGRAMLLLTLAYRVPSSNIGILGKYEERRL